MNLVDKVIQEWSYRTNKGYPDINCKQDMDLFETIFGFRLENILKEQEDTENNTYDKLNYYKEYLSRLIPSDMEIESVNKSLKINLKLQENSTNNSSTEKIENKLNEQEESSSDEISLDAIINLIKQNRDNKKLINRVYRTLSSSRDIDELKEILTNLGISKNTFSGRNLPAEIISIVVGGRLNNIKEFLDSTTTKFNLNGRGNLDQGFSKRFPTEKLDALANLEGFKDGVAMGKGEVIFPIVFSNVKLNTESAGDFLINGKNAELKKSPGARLSGSRANTQYKPFYKESPNTWTSGIQNDFQLGKEKDELDKVIKHMNDFIKNAYPQSKVRIQPDSTNVVLDFAKASIDSYIRDKNIDIYILFNSETRDYKSFYPATNILQAIDQGDVQVHTKANPQVKGFS